MAARIDEACEGFYSEEQQCHEKQREKSNKQKTILRGLHTLTSKGGGEPEDEETRRRVGGEVFGKSGASENDPRSLMGESRILEIVSVAVPVLRA